MKRFGRKLLLFLKKKPELFFKSIHRNKQHIGFIKKILPMRFNLLIVDTMEKISIYDFKDYKVLYKWLQQKKYIISIELFSFADKIQIVDRILSEIHCTWENIINHLIQINENKHRFCNLLFSSSNSNVD